MKRNDFVQIKLLEETALLGKAKELREEITGLVMDKNMNKLKDLKTIYKKKHDLAQILTVLRQKQMIRGLESKVLPVQVKEGAQT